MSTIGCFALVFQNLLLLGGLGIVSAGCGNCSNPACFARPLLRARAKVCARVGAALARSGIDPKLARALSLIPHLDPLAANQKRQRFEELGASEDDGLPAIFAAKIGDIARRSEDSLKLDFANASLAELLAWCLARPAGGPAGGPGCPV
jgi:hypothetical protein